MHHTIRGSKYPSIFLFSDNFIDGESLLTLIDDLDEFKLMVPQSGLRMKLKKLLTNKSSAVYSSVSIVNTVNITACIIIILSGFI